MEVESCSERGDEGLNVGSTYDQTRLKSNYKNEIRENLRILYSPMSIPFFGIRRGLSRNHHVLPIFIIFFIYLTLLKSCLLLSMKLIGTLIFIRMSMEK